MNTAPEGKQMLPRDDSPGKAMAAVSLWVALIAGFALIFIGIATTAMGFSAGLWVIGVGAVFSIGCALAIKFRPK